MPRPARILTARLPPAGQRDRGGRGGGGEHTECGSRLLRPSVPGMGRISVIVGLITLGTQVEGQRHQGDAERRAYPPGHADQAADHGGRGRRAAGRCGPRCRPVRQDLRDQRTEQREVPAGGTDQREGQRHGPEHPYRYQRVTASHGARRLSLMAAGLARSRKILR